MLISENIIEEIKTVLDYTWIVLRNWGWIIIPFILIKPAVTLWSWWRTRSFFLPKRPNILLEIKMPRHIPKPLRAMETVVTGLWQMYSAPNWHEQWWDGQVLQQFSFEIAAIDGIPHFYVRLPNKLKKFFLTHIYSQYPGAEVEEVEDYTQKVPQNIPNKDWNLAGTSYRTIKSDPYPIRTYIDFERENEDDEERKVDPMSSLLEGFAQLQPGEQVWIQIVCVPLLHEIPWVKEGKKIRDSMVKRKQPSPETPILKEVVDTLLFGPTEKKEVKEEVIPAELRLTPGEKEVVEAIEKKTSKLGFQCFLQYIYLGTRDVFFKGNMRLPMSYFTNFLTNNLNGLVPDGRTITKVKKKWYSFFWQIKRRNYLRQRRLFRHYIRRDSPFHPKPGGTFILNTEELATIFHFPSQEASPSSMAPRTENKKGEAPANIPFL
jgi:hypothetical protein